VAGRLVPEDYGGAAEGCLGVWLRVASSAGPHGLNRPVEPMVTVWSPTDGPVPDMAGKWYPIGTHPLL
jgi:hypothetical protein